jgi:hypothetical protein
MTILEKSTYVSLFIQFVTGVIDIWGLNLQVPETLLSFDRFIR